MDHFLCIQNFCNLHSDVLVTISTSKTGRPSFPSTLIKRNSEFVMHGAPLHRLSEEQFFDFQGILLISNADISICFSFVLLLIC